MIKFFVYAVAMLLCLIETAKAAVNIAVIAPKSGDYSDAAKDLISGVKAAVSEINNQGGLLGQSINLIEVDDQCDDRFNVSMAQMMAVNSSPEDKMLLVIGPYCGNKFFEVAKIYEDGKIMQIVPLPVDGEKLEIARKGLIKFTGTETTQAAAFFSFYKHKFINQNVALVYDGQNRSAVEIAAAIQQIFTDEKMMQRLTTYNFVNYGDDFKQMADEILLNNQVVYILGTSKNTAKLTREIGEIRNGTAIFTSRYALREDYTDIVSSRQKGLYFLALENLRDNPQFAETLVRLRLKRQEPRGLGAYGYLSVLLWKTIVMQANSFDYEKTSQVSDSAEFVLPWGKVKFKEGNPNKSAPYGVYGFSEGEYTQVY